MYIGNVKYDRTGTPTRVTVKLEGDDTARLLDVYNVVRDNTAVLVGAPDLSLLHGLPERVKGDKLKLSGEEARHLHELATFLHLHGHGYGTWDQVNTVRRVRDLLGKVL